MRYRDGFTLIELMITVVVLGVVLAITAPAMGNLVRSNRVTANANAVVSSMQYARSEAVKNAQPVVVCASSDQSTCDGAGSTDWSVGWISFVDANDNGTFEAANDRRLRVRGPLDNATLSSGGQGMVTYRPTGQVDQTLSLTLAPKKCEGKQQRGIDLNLIGRPNVQEEACP